MTIVSIGCCGFAAAHPFNSNNTIISTSSLEFVLTRLLYRRRLMEHPEDGDIFPSQKKKNKYS